MKSHTNHIYEYTMIIYVIQIQKSFKFNWKNKNNYDVNFMFTWKKTS